MTDNIAMAPTRPSLVNPPRPVVAKAACADGVRTLATAADLHGLVATGTICWIDIAGGDAAVRAAFLRGAGFADADVAWLQRFGQIGRLTVARHRLRAVTWVTDGAGNVSEIHLLCAGNLVLTVWDGDTRMLDDARGNFSERAVGLEKGPYEAAGIVLQLLLGTVDLALSELDAQLELFRTKVDEDSHTINLSKVTVGLQKLQWGWSNIDRYTSAARSAMIGVEALPGIGNRGAAELNDYADQVEDVAHRVQERYQWASAILQHYSARVAERQGEQINRLTLVSVIFLPLTFLTGFFGMNFNWMTNALSSRMAFLGLGILLPAANVIAVLVWFRRKHLI